MLFYFARMLRRWLVRFGLSVTVSRTVDQEQLHRLIKLLFPIKVTKQLIRIGGVGDGGYLVPDDLKEIGGVISPGVGRKQTFDEFFARRDVPVVMADASVDGPEKNLPQFHFIPKFVAPVPRHNHVTIEDLIEKLDSITGTRSDLILQMDIEGAEYEILSALSLDILERFRIVLIEFHDLDRLFDPVFFVRYKDGFESILRTHHVVHIHPNNCQRPVKGGDIQIPPVMEFTFYRKDLSDQLGFCLDFPNPLDKECTDQKPLALPDCWIGARS